MLNEFGPAVVATKLGITRQSVHRRRRRIELRMEKPIHVREHPNKLQQQADIPGRLILEVDNGIVLIGSDSHYWPGVVSTAHRAFVHFCRALNPKAIIKNGDELDGASISRFPPIGWEKRPTLADEIQAVKERLDEITVAAPKALRYWPLGNHDARFETRLATVAPEFAKIHGIHLKDHFVDWEPCWSVWINDEVVVKHRYKGGIWATRNNTLLAGKTILTGHLHSLKVTPHSDYNGTRYGVDCGSLAEPFGPQFAGYMEDNPRDWRSGFVVLTFRDGRLLPPEIVHVWEEGKVTFRGEIINV